LPHYETDSEDCPKAGTLLMRKANAKGGTFFKKYHNALIWFVLIVVTLAVYWQVQTHDFLNFDDDLYVAKNSNVNKGITSETIIWAFTTLSTGNWHPLTWLSHMLDIQFFGMNPRWHHLINLLYHVFNTLLLFNIFKMMTGDTLRSGFIAALFALHPMHVESVAWIAERKDVLSTFFWMLTVWSYLRYAQNQNLNRYLLAVLFFTLGLMAKPMLVTLPFVLLLLDYWPLERLRFIRSDQRENTKKASGTIRLLLEKTPFFVVTTLSSIVTFIVQKQGKNVASFEDVPFLTRAANAIVAYVDYIEKMLWPSNMAVLYPYPSSVSIWKMTVSGTILIIISLVVLRFVKQRPYLMIGWLWYLGTLVPVIGLVQVGNQYMADRYSYIPYIGLFIMIAWGVPDLLQRWRQKRIGIAITTAIIFAILMTVTFLQVRHWKNSITLFEHTLSLTADNFLPHNNLGTALAEQGRIDEAIDHWLEAIRIKSDYETPYNNLGLAYAKQGRAEEAIRYYFKALRINPDYELAHFNLGNVYLKERRLNEAIHHYKEAIRINPEYVNAYYSLANALFEIGQVDEAINQLLEAVIIKPNFLKAHNNLGNALRMQGRLDEAIEHYSEAIRINNNYADAHNNLGIALIQKGKIELAIIHFQKALEINPDFSFARNNLRKALFVYQQQNQ
jgi:tetratricopeptide (TPR) repeat protein